MPATTERTNILPNPSNAYNIAGQDSANACIPRKGLVLGA